MDRIGMPSTPFLSSIHTGRLLNNTLGKGVLKVSSSTTSKTLATTSLGEEPPSSFFSLT
jgi:hypothetical protein